MSRNFSWDDFISTETKKCPCKHNHWWLCDRRAMHYRFTVNIFYEWFHQHSALEQCCLRTLVYAETCILFCSLIFNACLLTLKNKPTLRNIWSKKCDVPYLLLLYLFEQEGVFLCLLVIWPYLPRSRIYILSGHTIDYFCPFLWVAHCIKIVISFITFSFEILFLHA